VTISLTLNGRPCELPDDATVSQALQAAGAPAGGRGCAVAVNGSVVPREQWSLWRLSDGAQVEVVVAVGGG
jgi:sulfur carrier protein